MPEPGAGAGRVLGPKDDPPATAAVRCWLWHRFGRWHRAERSYVLVAVSPPQYMIEQCQRRRCQRCGFLEERAIA